MKFATSILSLIFCASALMVHTSTDSEGRIDITDAYTSEVLGEIDDSASKLISLAGEFPDELYDWRPDEGVRSVQEVFAHIASGNYFLPTMMGAEIPEGVNPREFESMEMSKAELIELLEESFDHLRSVLGNVNERDLDEETPWFGDRSNTVRGVMLFLPKHIGEHQGQLIAYARINGVTPPWSQ